MADTRYNWAMTLFLIRHAPPSPYRSPATLGAALIVWCVWIVAATAYYFGIWASLYDGLAWISLPDWSLIPLVLGLVAIPPAGLGLLSPSMVPAVIPFCGYLVGTVVFFLVYQNGFANLVYDGWAPVLMYFGVVPWLLVYLPFAVVRRLR